MEEIAMEQQSISVVIPNYNGRKLLEENLPSVIGALHNSNVDYEIIIADDASSDNSVQFISSAYPQIKIIQSLSNQGFSPTINKGIQESTKDLVFALNSDVQLTPDYFINQFKYFKRDDTFGVMGRIIDLEGDRIQDGAKYPTYNWFKFKSTVNFIPVHQSSDAWIPTVFLSGANALMDRKKLQLLGGFDEIFRPFYLEDVDLSLRAWRMGWNCYYDHNSICKHPVSATIKNYHKEKKVRVISKRNRFIIHAIHFSGISKLMWTCVMALEFLFSWLTFKPYFYKAFFLYIKKINEVRASKNKLKSLLNTSNNSKTLHAVMDEVKSRIDHLTIQKF